MKVLPSIFKDENGNFSNEKTEIIKKARDDDAYDLEGFKDFLNRKYGESNERIISVNNEIVSQMMLLAKKNPGNTLIIFTGGAAHLPQALSLTSEQVVHQGVINALQEKLGESRVQACFFNNRQTAQRDYTPSPDVGLKYGTIPNKLVVPSKFTSDDLAVTVAAAPQVKDKKNHDRGQIFRKPGTKADSVFSKAAEKITQKIIKSHPSPQESEPTIPTNRKPK